MDTITFTGVNDFPEIINAAAPPYPQKAICEVTGLPAKYKDPLTGKPYATLAAFKTIRAKHKKMVKSNKAAQAIEAAMMQQQQQMQQQMQQQQ